MTDFSWIQEFSVGRGVKCIKLIVVITVQLHGFTESHEFFILNAQFVGQKNTAQYNHLKKNKTLNLSLKPN